MEINTFTKIETSFKSEYSIENPAFKSEEAKIQEDDAHSHYITAKRFLLDVKKAQSFYDDLHLFITPEFVLPFDNCLFAFEEPLTIKWIDRESKFYTDNKLLAINIFKTREFKTIGKEIIYEYKAFLYFEEDGLGDILAISNQFIRFVTMFNDKSKVGTFIHIDHYPCQNKLLCGGEDDSWLERGYFYKTIEKNYHCQEILTRDSLVDTLINLVNKIHEVQVEIVHKKIKHSPDDVLKPQKPFGWPFTKGNLPKDNYVQYLDGKRYQYDKEEINYGTGEKHRYRYDVRRHPRIVNNHIIWVEPHQRGSGTYIPKIYANRKTWFVNYIWFQAEKLTKFRVFEILMIKFMGLFK